MEQEVAHGREGYNSSHTSKGSGEMTPIIHIYIEDGSPVLRYRMMSGAPEMMDC